MARSWGVSAKATSTALTAGRVVKVLLPLARRHPAPFPRIALRGGESPKADRENRTYGKVFSA
jgi:hypothetical protein